MDAKSATWVHDLLNGGYAPGKTVYPPSYSDAASTNPDHPFYWGNPWHVVKGDQPRVRVIWDMPEANSGESDPGPYPLPPRAAVQADIGPPKYKRNYPTSVNVPHSDRHTFVIDKDNCIGYQMYNMAYIDGQYHAGLISVWDLTVPSQTQRPYGITSGSVSGMSQFAMMLHPEEIVGTAEIDHAIMASMYPSVFSASFVDPARMGQRNGSIGYLPDHSPIGPSGGSSLRLRYQPPHRNRPRRSIAR